MNSDAFDLGNFFTSLLNFILVFGGSFLIGSAIGCLNALISFLIVILSVLKRIFESAVLQINSKFFRFT